MHIVSDNCPIRQVCLKDGNGLVQIKDITDQAGLYGHGRLFAHLTVNPGCSIGPHVHEHETEFYYILRGEGIFNDNGTDVTVRPGDVCATRHGELHALENRGREPLELMALIVME